MGPKLSIIIPVYNAEDFIEDLIKTIERQTCDFEAIFVNDGSSDKSGSIIQRYVEHNPRFKYIFQNNSGANRARARGVTEAKGEWIVFVDADDLVSDNLSVICGMYCNSLKNDIIVTTTDLPPHISDNFEMNQEDYTKAIILQEIYTGPWAKFFRRPLFDDKTFNLPREIISAEDYLMNIRVAHNATNGAFLTTLGFHIGRDVNPHKAMKTFRGTKQYDKLYYECFKESFTQEQWEKYLTEIIERQFIVWHNNNRKRWRIPKNALEGDCYIDIRENLKKYHIDRTCLCA